MTEKHGLYLFIIKFSFFCIQLCLLDEPKKVLIWIRALRLFSGFCKEQMDKIWSHTFFQSSWGFWLHNVGMFENGVKAAFFHVL